MIVNCVWCKKDITEKHKYNQYDVHRVSCSKTCAAKYRHSDYYTPRTCKECGVVVKRNRLCTHCNKKLWDSYDSHTLDECTRQDKGPNRYVVIRTRARVKYCRSNKPQCCIECGYDKHFEVSHIKPISEFSGDTPVSVINDLDNLQALCPNCHWLHDHPIKPDGD